MKWGLWIPAWLFIVPLVIFIALETTPNDAHILIYSTPIVFGWSLTVGRIEEALENEEE